MYLCRVNILFYIYPGGETIREINRVSGAHVELNRDSQDGNERFFKIQGNPDQIQHAISLIHEKAGLVSRTAGVLLGLVLSPRSRYYNLRTSLTYNIFCVYKAV